MNTSQPCYPCTHNLKSVPVLPTPTSPDGIIDKACNFLDVNRETLISKRRDRELVEYRQMLMVLIYDRCHLSLKKLGRLFNRDHTTVIHAKATVSNLLFSDEVFTNKFNALKNYIFN